MGRLRTRVPNVVFCLVSLAAMKCAACGGGSSEPGPQPPSPPTADFSLSLSSDAISVAQGATSSAITVTVNALNGFTGSVQVTLSGLPTGVTTNPQSPFSVATGASTQVIFGAASSSATGNYTISAQGTRGSLAHSANLSLSIEAGVISSFPRSAYVRTDSVSSFDDPFGEPFHRHPL